LKTVRTRFAPSPTGYLHIGGLRTALYGYLYAKKYNGEFILRLEDTDRSRYVDGSVQIIYDTLNDAGIYYSEGPDKGGNYGPYIQSERREIYLEYAKKLVELGGAYYCFCDSARLETLTDENGIRKYDKHCLKLSKNEVEERLNRGDKYVIRQNIPLHGESSYDDLVYGTITVDYKDIEDGVLLKSDGMPTYNFANVVDDHLMNITHVIRGTEYLSSTPKYNLMYDAFGWERPIYIHLPPIMKNSKEKLSKRNGDASYSDFVEKGYVKESIINYIALLGWSPKDNTEKMSLKELEEHFSLEGINKSPAIFDEPKMKWLSGEYIKAMELSDFLRISMPFIEKSSIFNKGYDYSKICALLKTRVEIMSEIPEKINFLEEYGEYDLSMYEHKKMKTNKDIAKIVLPEARKVFERLNDYNHDILYPELIKVCESLSLKNGQLFWCIRVALTGQPSSPGGATEMADILGKERTLNRIDFSINLLNK